MPDICPTEQYCCDNDGSWWCWACGVACPKIITRRFALPRLGSRLDADDQPSFATASMPSFENIDVLMDIDQKLAENALANDQASEQLVIQMARILEKAGGWYPAERLLQRIAEVAPADIDDLRRAQAVAEALRHRARLVRKIRNAVDQRIKELGG